MILINATLPPHRYGLRCRCGQQLLATESLGRGRCERCWIDDGNPATWPSELSPDHPDDIRFITAYHPGLGHEYITVDERDR
jgi:hypothetical protein